MYIMTALSHSLNYASLKRKSVACRNYRCNLTPTNQNRFNSSDHISFSLPTKSRSYLDLANCYLKFSIETSDKS